MATNGLMASSSVFLHRPRLAFSSRTNQAAGKCGNGRVSFMGIGTRRIPVVLSMTASADSGDEVVKSVLPGNGISIMVNGCSGKMGKAVIKAADSAGVNIVPISFGSSGEDGQTVEVCGKEITVHGPTEREKVLSSVFEKHPELIVVDYTIPSAVNDNAELYSKVGVPFVMGTTGGDRNKLYETVEEAKIYAVISPQMGKQVVAFLAAMEIMAEQFPGAFSGYSLDVMESHQASKLDASGTAKAVISCFQELGVSYDMDQVLALCAPNQLRTMLERNGSRMFRGLNVGAHNNNNNTNSSQGHPTIQIQQHSTIERMFRGHSEDVQNNNNDTNSSLGHSAIQIQPPSIMEVNNDNNVIDVTNLENDCNVDDTVSTKATEDDDIFGGIEDIKFEHKMPSSSIYDYASDLNCDLNQISELDAGIYQKFKIFFDPLGYSSDSESQS